MNNVVKELQPRNWRSKQTHDTYVEDRKDIIYLDECPLCSSIVKREFSHWKIVPNKYPYDAVASLHDMIISKRHVTWGELTDEELVQLSEIKREYLADNYTFMLEAFPKHRSVPGHFHLHLIVAKKIS